jgi:hypothetical protein
MEMGTNRVLEVDLDLVVDLDERSFGSPKCVTSADCTLGGVVVQVHGEVQVHVQFGISLGLPRQAFFVTSLQLQSGRCQL